MISGALGAALFGIQSYSVIFLMGAAFSIAMGLYFFSKHPFTRVSYTFLALMLFIFLASVLSFVLVNVPDEGVAALTARLLVAAILLAYSGIFLLYSMMAYQEQIGRISEHLLPYALVSLVVAAIPAYFVEVQEGTWGWGIPVSLSMGLLYAVIAAFILLSILLLISFFPMTDSRVKYTSLFTTFGTIAPVIVAFPLGLSGVVGYALGLVIGLLLTTLIFSAGVLRYDLFASVLILEEDKPSLEVEEGHYPCTLIEGKDLG